MPFGQTSIDVRGVSEINFDIAKLPGVYLELVNTVTEFFLYFIPYIVIIQCTIKGVTKGHILFYKYSRLCECVACLAMMIQCVDYL